MAFEDDTYLVLDVPHAPWTDRILELRTRWDPWRAALPVEITLVGSGGVGPLKPVDDEESVYPMVERIAEDTAPIQVSFTALRFFPGTALYYLEPTPARPLEEFHRRLATSGIQFRPSAFPFVAHCTVANLGQQPEAQAISEIRALELPSENIRLDSMSMYTITKGKCRLVRRWPVSKRQ